MKVAVVLSGELRTFDECYPSMREHILDRNDYDKAKSLFGWRTTVDVMDWIRNAN